LVPLNYPPAESQKKERKEDLWPNDQGEKGTDKNIGGLLNQGEKFISEFCQRNFGRGASIWERGN